MDAEVSNPRTSQACEPCRRKKSKCTGEKPACSFCQRLGQTCFYYDRGNGAARDGKRRRMLPPEKRTKSVGQQNSTNQRLGELEATVEGIINAFTRSTGSTRATALTQSPAAANVLQNGVEDDFDAVDWLAKNTILSFETLAEAYIETFHGQPLLLFDISMLSEDLQQWPKHLFFSFFALTSRFADYQENVRDLVLIAQRHISLDCPNIVVGIQTIQSLCLLILWEISHGEATTASVHIGIAQVLSQQLLETSCSDESVALDVSRCWCSVMILDCMFSQRRVVVSMPCAAPRSDEAMSPALPRCLHSTVITTPTNMDFAPPQDTGIYSICIDLYEIWAKSLSLVENVRKGHTASFWSAQSSYHEVRTTLFDFETKMSSNHRLRDVAFANRAPAEIGSCKQYWRLWFTSQVLFHAIQLIINHPLIHIINGRRLCKFQPPSFQQQTIDQTLLHAKWIVRLHEMRVEKGLEIDDPFISHLSAVVATAYIFFINSKDPKVNTDARKGFNSCRETVRLSAQKWEHLQRTCNVLDVLFESSLANDADEGKRTARVTWFWDLLSYQRATADGKSDFSSEIVQLEMTTQFTSPIDGPDVRQVESSTVFPNDVQADAEFDLGPNDPWILSLDTDFLTGSSDITTFGDDYNQWLGLGQL